MEISQLRSVTCHMGSHSVTCHPTQMNTSRLTPAIQAGTRFTYPGGMEGDLLHTDYRDGFPARRLSPIQVLAGSSVD